MEHVLDALKNDTDLASMLGKFGFQDVGGTGVFAALGTSEINAGNAKGAGNSQSQGAGLFA